jgi:hypothetical protein
MEKQLVKPSPVSVALVTPGLVTDGHGEAFQKYAVTKKRSIPANILGSCAPYSMPAPLWKFSAMRGST